MNKTLNSHNWQFCIDRGGTFTDCIGYSPEGEIKVSKILSSDDAPIAGIKKLLNLTPDQSIPQCSVKMGTTIGTNALLEHKGAPFALLITKGFADCLEIGTQQRPDIFDIRIKKAKTLYQKVIEIEERISAHGRILIELKTDHVQQQLTELLDQGFKNIAIVFVHSYLYPVHEKLVSSLAQKMGFELISSSHEICPEIGLTSRGDTGSVDAYLTPLLRDYLNHLSNHLHQTELLIMQSNGGLAAANQFRGHYSILSGPAGGVVACKEISTQVGIEKLIGFDMGGTSTDVSRYDGLFDRVYETMIAGIRIKAPMMHIHTVAAGGGSICRIIGGRFTVGPESAGSYPGPLCYHLKDKENLPVAENLTLTDVNFYLDRVLESNFPFKLNRKAVEDNIRSIEKLCQQQGYSFSDIEIAQGFLDVANTTMAQAIKKITVARGHDAREYALCCFGGASGQHACAIADILGIETMIIPYLSGVLSAYGIGQADIIREDSLPVSNKIISETVLNELAPIFNSLVEKSLAALKKQGISKTDHLTFSRKLDLRFKGTHTSLTILEPKSSGSSLVDAYQEQYLKEYQQLFGYVHDNLSIEIVQCRLEIIAPSLTPENPKMIKSTQQDNSIQYQKKIYFHGQLYDSPIFQADHLSANYVVNGPAIILDDTQTIILEPGYSGEYTVQGHFIIKRISRSDNGALKYSTELNPITLEIFNNLFMSIAEQMGEILKRSSVSPNIKDRMDFSCAIFDQEGRLVANAPHIPVHLGSMGECVKNLLRQNISINPGDVFITNDPISGGSHLPDITLITPVFSDHDPAPVFFTASRAHHADIGGKTPGSLPAFSSKIEDEGILIKLNKIVANNQFKQQLFDGLFLSGDYPARKPGDNLTDIQAQIAANNFGQKQLAALCNNYSLKVVLAYMNYIQENAEHHVQEVIRQFPYGLYHFIDQMDDGTLITACIQIKEKIMTIDFSGTGSVNKGNLNAPKGVVFSAVLYVLRTLVSEHIPLNEGCLKPIDLIIPENTIINPTEGSAVVGGNVETSQRLVDVLFGALGVCAASQGTMNNIAFGNKNFGYYETLCGGAGASNDYHGADGVHTNMTNTRITDVEVLEIQFPIRLNSFSIRVNSGGNGRFRGGNGIIRTYQFLEDMEISLLTERRIFAPYGMNGGESGKKGNNIRITLDGREISLKGKDYYQAKIGECLRITTPGGGGWGRKN